ncbi:MAG: type II toxin-antitoxin system VapC family toxin [Spirochaetia bacterium]
MVVDTCFCIDIIRERKAGVQGPGLKKLNSLKNHQLYISLFSVCELRAGAELTKKAKVELGKIELLLDYINIVYPDVSFSVLYGEAEASLRRNGTPIPVMDLLIGISAKSLGMPLVTKDEKHFCLIPGLAVETY